MNNALFSRTLKSETVEVDSEQGLVGIIIQGDHFTAQYRETRVTPSEELPARNFTVDRSIATLDQEFIDWVNQGVAMAEKWRQADEDQRAADAAAQAIADAAWNAMTPDQRLDSVKAQQAANEAAIEQAAVKTR